MPFHRDPASMRRFYDGFHPWYRFVEGGTGRSIATALETMDPAGNRFSGDSLLEHCAGSGSLALQATERFASYEGRDQSEGMLGRARSRWVERFGASRKPPFRRESVLDFADPADSVDWIAIAFALHLFSPEEERRIIAGSLRSARKGVLVIDHSTAFSPFLSLIEAIEGSWYEAYRRLDFVRLAEELGARLVDRHFAGTRVMEFLRA